MQADIEIEGVTDRPEFVAELYQSKRPFRQKWRFRVIARNGRIVATSEAYVNRSDAENIAWRLVGAVRGA